MRTMVSEELEVRDPERFHPLICLSLDISQVQCIKSYQAQEHDELTLEKADILHAKTITSDGKTSDELSARAPGVPLSS